MRRYLLAWHPAPASSLLLILISFPMVLSLLATALLFSPALEASLVSEHCHTNCVAHVPHIGSFWLTLTGLLILSGLTSVLLGRLLVNLHKARTLHKQLSLVATDKTRFYFLDDPRPMVFTLGWLRNIIYVTDGLIESCEAQDFSVVLAHEEAHCRRKDNVRLLLARLVLMVLPPKLARQCSQDLHLLSESACDFVAAAKFGSTNVAETLLKIQRLSTTCFSWQSQQVYSPFTGAEVELRIQNLLSERPLSIAQRMGLNLSVLSLIVLSIVLVDPLHHGMELLLS